MKNYITKNLLLSLIATVTISGKLMAMNVANNFDDCIDLKLNQKPQNVSTYDWCRKIANDLVKEKRKAALDLLGIKSEQEWEQRKKILKKELLTQNFNTNDNCNCTVNCNDDCCCDCECDCGSCCECDCNCDPFYANNETKEKLLPNWVKKIIIKFLNNPNVKNQLEITKITDPNEPTVEIERKNGSKIKFLNTDKERKHSKNNLNNECCDDSSGAWTDGKDVYVSTKTFIKDKFSEAEIMYEVGHELGHIICKHTDDNAQQEKDLFYREYYKQYEAYKKPLDESQKQSTEKGNKYDEFSKQKQHTKKPNESLNEYCDRIEKSNEKSHKLLQEYIDLSKKFIELSQKINKFNDDFNCTKNNILKAQEFQADIVGIFNTPDIAKGGKTLFEKSCNNESSECCSCDSHPSYKTRAKYMSQIYEFMLKDQKKPAKPAKKEVKTQKTSKTKTNTVEPKPSTQETIVIKPSRPKKTYKQNGQTPGNKTQAPTNKPVILNQQTPAKPQTSKVSEMAKKFEQEQNKKKNLQKK